MVLVTASEDGTAKLWDVHSGACKRSIDTVRRDDGGGSWGEAGGKLGGTEMITH